MDEQKINQYVVSIVNHILALQTEGYHLPVLKLGRETDPAGELRECIVLDISYPPAAIAKQNADEVQFKADKKQGKIAKDVEFTKKEEIKTINFFYG